MELSNGFAHGEERIALAHTAKCSSCARMRITSKTLCFDLTEVSKRFNKGDGRPSVTGNPIDPASSRAALSPYIVAYGSVSTTDASLRQRAAHPTRQGRRASEAAQFACGPTRT